MVQAKHSTLWPADATPSTLLCLRVKGKADDVFKTLWINPELAANLHKLRNDTNLVEGPWMGSKEELPQPQYTWEPPAVPAGSNTVGPDRWRKARFESPPAALASKPFQNEEIHHCTEYRPGHSYVLYCQANTSAPYGDKFDVLFKCIILAEDKSNSLVHISFHVQWSPAMNRMMKAMIAKAVEGGVRGTYKQYRQVLETLHPCEDITEAAFSELLAREPLLEGVPERAAPPTRAHVPEPAAALGPPQALAAVEPASLFSYAFGQLVWGEQVRVMAGVAGAGMRSAASEGLVARVMAAVVTLSLIHAAVTLLHSVQTFCHDQRHVFWLLCLPITHGVDLPDSLSEVLVSLLLVALINWAIIWGAQTSMTYGGKAVSALPASLTAPVPSPGVSSQATAAPETAEASPSQPDGPQAAAGEGPSPSGGSTSAGQTAGPASGSSKPPVVPTVHVSKAGPKRADIVPPKGRTPAAVPAASITSASSNSRSSTSPTPHTPNTPTPVITAPPQPVTIPKHSTSPKRRGNSPRISFTGTSTQAPLQMEMTSLPPTPKEAISPTGGSDKLPSPPLPSSKPIPIPLSIPPNTLSAVGSKLSLTAATSALPAASTTASAAASPATSPHETSLLSVTTPHGAAGKSLSTTSIVAAPPRVASANTVQAVIPSSKSGTALEAMVATGSEPLPSPTRTESPEPPTKAGPPITPDNSVTSRTSTDGIDTAAVAGKQASVGPAPVPTGSKSSSGAAPPPLVKSSSTVGGAAGAGASSPTPTPPLTSAGGSGSHTQQVFGAQYPPGAMPPNMINSKDAEPMKAWIKSVSDSMDAFAEGFKGAFGMKLDETGSGSVNGGLPSPGSASEQPKQVEEEVFENERFQPFRGWGHTWPGHFLPSDRLGHWSDAAGGPGGTASMIFEQVEPPLPPGYMWLEEEWQLDMEALDREGVDECGWTYALDFNYLKHPPPAGTGKCTLKHFVRRRRWFRTRVLGAPGAVAPMPQQLMIKGPADTTGLSNSPSFDVGVASIEPHSQHEQHFAAADKSEPAPQQQAQPAVPAGSATGSAPPPPPAVSASVSATGTQAVASSGSSSGSSSGDSGKDKRKSKQHAKTRLAQSSLAGAGATGLEDEPEQDLSAVLMEDEAAQVEASDASLLDPAGGLPAAMSQTSTLKLTGDSMTAHTGDSTTAHGQDGQVPGKARTSEEATSPVKGGSLHGGHSGLLGGPAGKVARRAAGSAALGKALDVALISSAVSVDAARGSFGVGQGAGMGEGEGQAGWEGSDMDTLPAHVARHRRELSSQSTSSNHPLRTQDSL